MLSKLFRFFLSHALDLMVFLASELPLVLTAEPRPQPEIYHRRHGHHSHGDSVTFHEPRLVVVWVQLQIAIVSFLALVCLGQSRQIKLTKGAAIPAELPIVNCKPVATVRLP